MTPLEVRPLLVFMLLNRAPRHARLGLYTSFALDPWPWPED
jgi:hypothetical protein